MVLSVKDSQQRVSAHKYASRIAFGIAVTAILVLVGWFLDATILKSVHAGFETMKANTAISFLLTALVLRWHARTTLLSDSGNSDISTGHEHLSTLFMLGAGLMVSLTLMEYIFKVDIGIDELLIKDGQGKRLGGIAGRMSPATATAFLFLIAAYYCFKSATKAWWTAGQWLSIAAIFIAYTALLGYTFDVAPLYRLGGATSIAVHTAVLFVLLATGMLALQPSVGIVRLVMGDDAGGVLARRLLPGAFLLSPFFAWLRWQGELAGYYDTRVGLAIYASSNVVMFTALVWWTGLALQRKDHEKAQLIDNIREKSIELQRFSDALERSNVELRRFAYVASHDLQTPLRAITSFTQLIQRSTEITFTPETADWMQRVLKNTRRMQELIQNLLDYARVDSDGQPFTEVDLNIAMASAKETLAGMIAESDAKITSAELPTVHGDVSQLTQLLQNLLSNALKYRRRDHLEIEVSSYSNEVETVISVRDNGIGIDPKHHARVFEMFQRLHSQQAYPGTGIGLAICRRVVQHHGGRLWVESQAGHGSTFFFSIPVSEKISEKETP